MSKLNRGIRNEFVEALNNEYKKDSWWQTLIDDQSLFLGIRDEYVDLYLNGGRLLKLRFVRNAFVGETHFKYLLNLTRTDSKSEYVKFKNGMFEPINLNVPYQYISADLSGIKSAVLPYQGEEKQGVHKIMVHNKNVIDMEIQFPEENRRVDFAALQKVNGIIKLVFFEAKSYLNSQIRHPSARPEVLKQIEEYERIIRDHRDEIKQSYEQVIDNIRSLEGWSSRRSSIVAEAASSGFTVDPEVRLVIFNFKNPQKKEASSPGGDFTRLCSALGKHRVLTRGNPKKFETGIKSPE